MTVKTEGICSVQDCGRYGPVIKGFCASHYVYQRIGRPLDPIGNKPRGPRPRGLTICKVGGRWVCDRQTNRKVGFCDMHRNRLAKGTQMDAPLRSYNTPVRISGAHSRVKSLWGSASNYPCISCQARATQWAYDGTDPSFMMTEGGQRYSIYPEFYMPMCTKCHVHQDKTAAKAELLEYRVWKQQMGVKSIHEFMARLSPETEVAQ